MEYILTSSTIFFPSKPPYVLQLLIGITNTEYKEKYDKSCSKLKSSN